VRTGTCVCCAVRPDVDVGAASKGLTKSCNASHTVELDTKQVLNKGSVECFHKSCTKICVNQHEISLCLDTL